MLESPFRPDHACRWQDADAARSYENRPPYPAETFDILESLITGRPRHVLAIAGVRDDAAMPWSPGLLEIIQRHSTTKDFRRFDMLAAWESAGLFRSLGRRATAKVEFSQSIEAFIDAKHAMSSLTRAHIDAPAFDAELRALLAPHCPDGIVRRPIHAEVAWGSPLAPQTP